ncbi:hypothetical protein [Thalassotalea maritima]|uniref:hypothetical protein n=1 Tax=Thalassotalea maritima TaxID=3242416 RepID=UPI003527FEB3
MDVNWQGNNNKKLASANRTLIAYDFNMIILDQDVPLRHNMLFALKQHRPFWLLLILTACLDYLTTIYFMHYGGIDLEANRIIRELAHTFGMYAGVAIGKVLQLCSALAFCALSREMSRPILLLIIGLNCVAIFINSYY